MLPGSAVCLACADKGDTAEDAGISSDTVWSVTGTRCLEGLSRLGGSSIRNTEGEDQDTTRGWPSDTAEGIRNVGTPHQAGGWRSIADTQ
jgi:hypothetical protein